jgi:hypothetical protein
MKTQAIEAPRESPEPFAALAAAVHPDWLSTIERLSNAVTCVSCQIDQLQECKPGRTFVECCESLVQNLITLLDGIGPDPDLEPSLGRPMGLARLAFNDGGDDREQDGADGEPSLGSHEIREGGAVSYLFRSVDGYLDCEDEHDGREEESFRHV